MNFWQLQARVEFLGLRLDCDFCRQADGIGRTLYFANLQLRVSGPLWLKLDLKANRTRALLQPTRLRLRLRVRLRRTR